MPWKDYPIFQREDKSFIIAVNEAPYHVPNEGEWIDLYAEVAEFYANNADCRSETEIMWEDLHPEPMPPEPTPEELAEQALAKAKAERAAAVASITVEVDGMVFDGDEKAQERMARAVTLADSPEETTEWVLHDNTIAIVTAEQLRRACKLAGKAQTVLWTKPYTDTVTVNETNTETNTHYTLE